MLQHPEGHESCDALPVRRNLVQFHVIEGLADRAAPIRLVLRKIIQRHRAAVLVGERHHFLGQRTFVERPAPGFGNQTQAARCTGIAKPLARTGSAAVGHEGFGKARLVA